MPKADFFSIAAVVFLSLYAPLGVYLPVFKELNEIRNKILGFDDIKRQISSDEKKTYLKNDWIPLAIGTTAIMLILGVLIAFMPFIAEPFIEQAFKGQITESKFLGIIPYSDLVFYLAAAPSLCGGISCVYGFFSEYLQMRKAISDSSNQGADECLSQES